MQQKLQKLKTNFLFFLELQLLISIVVLPILITWGLPISMMTIIGNLIFAQFLTAFIFVSSVLFVFDLLGIPNYWVMQALELITNIWHYFLSFGSSYWLIGFSSWMFFITSIFAMIALSLYFFTPHSQTYRVGLLATLCLATPLIHTLFQNKNVHTIVMQGSQKMHLIKTRGKVYAFDCGALGARPNSQSWIEYTLTSTMIKTMGTNHIDLLVLCNSNSRTQQAAQDLMQHISTNSFVHVLNNGLNSDVPLSIKKLQTLDL